MPIYSVPADTNTSNTSPKLKQGKLEIFTTTSVYWIIGENPVAGRQGCALLRAGESIELRLPVNCSKLAVLAVSEPGAVTVTEVLSRVKASCSA